MKTDYFDELLELAFEITELAEAESTLDKSEWKAAKERHDQLERRFKKARDKYIDVLLSTAEGQEKAPSLVQAQIAQIRDECDPSWLVALQYVSDGLVPQLHAEAKKHPSLRKLTKMAPFIVFVVIAISYFSVRLLSSVPITDVAESRKGIQQRAEAVNKVIRYDDWMSTKVRKGGWIKGIVFWPIEPTESEIKGASEFASLVFAAQEIGVERFGCSQVPSGIADGPSEEEMDMLNKVAEAVASKEAEWSSPPVFTVLRAVRHSLGC